MKEKKKWFGSDPIICDICKIPFNVGKNPVFYDAFVPAFGQWGLICNSCFIIHNCSLGTGKGQKYNLKTLEKLEG